MIRSMLVMMALLISGGKTFAALNVAYINASGGSVGYLSGYGINVTNINNPIGLTLASLAGYDAILVSSNTTFTESLNVGNVAADFADSGRGVVLAQFDFQGMWQLSGRIMTPGYSPFVADPLSVGYAISDTLGSIYDAGNPILSGISPGGVSTSFQAAVTLDPGAALVADWTSGRHAIAHNALTSSSVVGLNLFPDAAWSSTADTQHLVANALVFSVASPSVVPEPASLAIWSLLSLTVAGGTWWRRRRAAA